MNSFYTLSLFNFFLFGSAVSTFTFCSNSSCDPTLMVLADIVNTFKNAYFLIENWKISEHYCFWVCISCDIVRNITNLNFGKMSLMGTISTAFSNLTYLRTLVLDHNNLTGQVPDSLTKLTKFLYLDISNNNISGPLPTFDSLVEIIVDGNPLLQTSLSMPPKNEENEGAGNKERKGENEEKKHENETGNFALTKWILVILVAIIFIVVVFVFVFYQFYTDNRRHKVAQSDLNNEPVVQVVTKNSENDIFSIQLLRQATNNFAQDNILGQGGCGVVYRGELDDGSKIAIKKMNFQDIESRGLNEFQAEIDVLTRVRHRHLVALLSYCADGNERFLVYEYMPQGTLTQHLFNWQHNGYAPLTWKQRIVIVLDVARGIEYLHSLATQSFIHRDLKPSNILLNNDLRAKVADFGLVKNAPVEQSSVETRLAGTFGYLAPEYGATGRVTTKIDVYAFGAILMEIVTGRRALDYSLGEDQSHLVTWFRQILMKNESIQNIVDQTLDLNEETLESIQKVVELAMQCTTLERHHRPDMNYVVNILDSLVDEWIPTISNDEDKHEALRIWHAKEGTSTFEIETPETLFKPLI